MAFRVASVYGGGGLPGLVMEAPEFSCHLVAPGLLAFAWVARAWMVEHAGYPIGP